MGTIEKNKLIEDLRLDGNFSTEEITLVDQLIKADKLRGNEAIMDSKALTLLEENGLRDKFLNFCKLNGIFSQWVHNSEKGLD